MIPIMEYPDDWKSSDTIEPVPFQQDSPTDDKNPNKRAITSQKIAVFTKNVTRIHTIARAI